MEKINFSPHWLQKAAVRFLQLSYPADVANSVSIQYEILCVIIVHVYVGYATLKCTSKRGHSSSDQLEARFGW